MGTEYGHRQAAIYDVVYGTRNGKDWGAEAEMLATRIKTLKPGASSVLDVACGTGNHLVTMAQHFEIADGVELSAGMCEVARTKLPSADIVEADMREFDLGKRYDAITCMCYSIAYPTSVGELKTVLSRMAAHLNPGGVVIVEPWWTPETFLPGYFAASAYQDSEQAITRVSHTVKDGNTSRMTIHYTVADHTGVESFTELDVLSLFHISEYTDAFESAGLTVQYHPGPPTGRGLFVATAPN
ncbi:class I SAM-dependent methyltransferase [Crossiella sp. CA198]|uniref:class I SAM-dependent methyltransferase n=1 Tax=Crossiella sp. CA198 TaxID=3455607 RepID=UPI003F8D419D